MDNLDKNTVRELQERDYVRQEAAAQHEGEAPAAEERHACLTGTKASRRRPPPTLRKEPNAVSDKMTGLEAHITELQRMLNKATSAARAANKVTAVVSELEAHLRRLMKRGAHLSSRS
eukprot:6206548-Pleurochrysis_carterae.AAC.3